jgi:hypothetical protein
MRGLSSINTGTSREELRPVMVKKLLTTDKSSPKLGHASYSIYPCFIFIAVGYPCQASEGINMGTSREEL